MPCTQDMAAREGPRFLRTGARDPLQGNVLDMTLEVE